MGCRWGLVLFPLLFLLLLRAGVERNPGPGSFLCTGCHVYTTDIKHNMTRHVKFNCKGKKIGRGGRGTWWEEQAKET